MEWKLSSKYGLADKDWGEGYIHSEDTQCFVKCKCGEELSVADYEVVICPNCGLGYITEFRCYRLTPKESEKVQRFIEKDKAMYLDKALHGG